MHTENPNNAYTPAFRKEPPGPGPWNSETEEAAAAADQASNGPEEPPPRLGMEGQY